MLAHILAVLVGTGSVSLYVVAFFFPEIHRKQDFIWSGVGFFYALSLWIYARRITGGVLVGETASVALLGWFVWQTLKLRRQLVPTNQQTPIPSTNKIQQQLGLKQKERNNQPKAPTKSKQTTSTTESVTLNPTPVAEPVTRKAVAIEVDVPLERQQQPQTPSVSAVRVPVDRASQQKPPTPPVSDVRVPVEVKVERKQQQPLTPTIPTPAAPPIVAATIPAPIAVPIELKQPQPLKVITPVPDVPAATVAQPVVLPIEPQQPQPPTKVAVTPEENEAWIKLEVKSSPTTPKPIGQPAKPPTTSPTPPAAIAAESVARHIPTDAERIEN